MKAYEFSNYKDYVNKRLRAMPKQGHGQLAKIANELSVHPTLISQVFKGEKDLTLEQGHKLASYLLLDDLETDFFLASILQLRSGTDALKKYYRKKIEELRERATDLATRIPKDVTLTEEVKGVFYSSWYYSGVRLMTTIPGMDSADKIADALQLPLKTVIRTVDFLKQSGLVVEEAGKLRIGPVRTYLEAESPHVSKHHVNWRVLAMNGYKNLKPTELAFTCPVTISESDSKWIREKIVSMIDELMVRVDESPAEKLACLTIDWFDIA